MHKANSETRMKAYKRSDQRKKNSILETSYEIFKAGRADRMKIVKTKYMLSGECAIGDCLTEVHRVFFIV